MEKRCWGNTFYNLIGKRIFDIVLSALALIVFSPVFIIIMVIIMLDSPGNPFFIQRRFGKGMDHFNLIKFRSMRSSEDTSKGQFDPGDGSRVTKIGKILRQTKIDELPQLFNVFKGDMSIVGARPEIDKYINLYRDDFKSILLNRPGLSDFASIKYHDEEIILSFQDNAENYYLKIILPDKLKLSKVYSENICLKTDLYIIKETIYIIMRSLQHNLGKCRTWNNRKVD